MYAKAYLASVMVTFMVVGILTGNLFWLEYSGVFAAIFLYGIIAKRIEKSNALAEPWYINQLPPKGWVGWTPRELAAQEHEQLAERSVEEWNHYAACPDCYPMSMYSQQQDVSKKNRWINKRACELVNQNIASHTNRGGTYSQLFRQSLKKARAEADTMDWNSTYGHL